MTATTPSEPIVDGPGPAEPFPSIRERLARWWSGVVERYDADPWRVVEMLVTVATLALSTALVLATLNPGDLFSTTTPTGGDMGSHVWGPRYLIDHLLPHGRLTGWTPDWYNGFPAYQFYMVVPSLFIVVLHVGLPWYFALLVVAAVVAGLVAAWSRPALYRWRWIAFGLGALAVIASISVDYNRSFKIVTAIGLLALPFACWVLAKAADLPFPIPPMASVGGLIFLFNREPLFNNTGNIIGGNFQSTMAGEFAFSVSLTLAVLYLAVAVRGLRTGRHRALAALLFALAGLCHLIPAFFVLGCTGALFVLHPDRKRLKWLATMVPVAGLLTAFWVVPFLLRADYVNDMGWERLPLATGEETSYWYYLLPNGLRYLFAAGALGVVVSIVRRYTVGMVLAMAWAGVAIAFVALPQARLWNARLLPFQYLSVSLLACIGVGEIIRTMGVAASGDPKRPLRLLTVGGGAVAVLGGLLYVAMPITGILPNQISRVAYTNAAGEGGTRSSFLVFSTTSVHPGKGWSAYNYSGLEGKQAAPVGCADDGTTDDCTTGGWIEYRDLVRTMAGIGESEEFGCGRAFWEYDGDRIGGYGTPMALMMFPYFTNGCIGSQEGLYFESSATVPYHFIVQSELSTSPSRPQRDLAYPDFDIDSGVSHLQLLGVRYYLATTPNAVDQASRHPDLTEIAVSGPWHIYEVADADPVSPLEFEPVVVEGVDESQDGWLPTSIAWFRSAEDQSVPLAAHGPDDWERVDADPVSDDLRSITRWIRDQLGQPALMDQVPVLPQTPLPDNEVSNIEMGNDTISFDVTEPGVPVLVKTSYFPNWKVEGGDGPYRVTPNLMVVIPNDTHVEMTFGRTPVDYAAMAMSFVGLISLVLLARARPIDVEPERPTRLSLWIDDVLTIHDTAPLAAGPLDGDDVGLDDGDDLELDHDDPDPGPGPAPNQEP